MNHLEKAMTVPMPPRVAKRPRDKRGYPIPYTAEILPDGTPDFTAVNMEKFAACEQRHLCGLCGEKLKGFEWFVGGPRCATNRLFFDHPMHEACATYAVQVCPYLAMPKWGEYKARGRPANQVEITAVSTERPERFMLGKTRGHRVVHVQGQVLLYAKPWVHLTFWKHGQPAPCLQVQSKQCATCIYLPHNAGMLPKLEADVTDGHGFYKGHRTCHHSKDVCCRGFWNAHKDEFPLGQVAQRLGLVQFVNVDTLKE